VMCLGDTGALSTVSVTRSIWLDRIPQWKRHVGLVSSEYVARVYILLL
jgi:hypothetical protein